ncbi:MAG: pro-sigmaK processing inhibitor BofA family protein [Clostridia bacterium]|nr:pro-sigmaK processing inhibitor BofA family protein [Clostridia bacterium]
MSTDFASAVSETLNIQISEYIPLIVVCAVLALTFLFFKLLGVTSKILWKILINGIIGAGMLCLFDIVFVTYLKMTFFKIPITWATSLVAGFLGIPGVLLLLLLQFIL